MKELKGFAIFLALLIFLGSCSSKLYTGEFAQVDISQMGDGVIRVRYTGENSVRVKVQITRGEGENYNYDLPNDGSWEKFTLTDGNGDYTLRVLENREENRYKSVFDCTLALNLEDSSTPFRRSNQYVSFTEDSNAVKLAVELTANLESERDKISAVFQYVVEHITYDTEKADTVERGYLPDVDTVLEKGKGICFDYAALMAAMLRSQGIACKLIVGWTGEQYHAWVEVLRGENWQRMDPTFFSVNEGSEAIRAYIADDSNYRPVYSY